MQSSLKKSAKPRAGLSIINKESVFRNSQPGEYIFGAAINL